MANVTPNQIRELRERTQAGMADCKNALVEADGDLDKAVEIIQKKGLAKVAKRAAAVATEGEIRATLSADGRSGVLVEINIQTDFASKNEKFQGFLTDVNALALSAKSLDDLLAAKLPSGKSVSETRDELIASIGEKIEVRRFARLDLEAPAGRVHAYVHMKGSVGVLLATEAESAAVAEHAGFLKFVDDTAMQICAMAPQYIERSQVPAVDLAKQKEIYLEQLKTEGKPEKSWDKIVEGKAAKWYTEICLVDQLSVIVEKKSVEEVRADTAKEAGGSVKLSAFVRFGLGEGLQKKADDFVAEAKRMSGTE